METKAQETSEDVVISDFSPVLQAQLEITSLFKRIEQTCWELENMKAQLQNMDKTIDAQVDYLKAIKEKIESALDASTGDLF